MAVDFLLDEGTAPDERGGASAQRRRLLEVAHGDGPDQDQAGPAATTNARTWNGTGAPSPPTTAATAAATAISPRVSVTVSNSATPSTAAKTSQTIKLMAAPLSSAAMGGGAGPGPPTQA